MREYGPTVFPAYVAAKIRYSRSVSYLDQLLTLDVGDLRELVTVLTS